MTTRRYRLLPHTADIRLEVRGKDLPDLFSACVESLFSLVADRRKVRAGEERVLKVSGTDDVERLYFILREALLLFSSDRFLARSARVTMRLSEVEMKISGEPYAQPRHCAFREIKAVTAHGMEIRKVPGGYAARFVVDV